MELGARLRQARLEAGLSQRQLCGGEITRNMLSQIENGSARPSMATLRYLAGRLGRPVSYFLEEDAVILPNLAVMESARAAYSAGCWEQARQAMAEYQQPDPVFDAERALLLACACLKLAEQALEQQRDAYALRLLREAEEAGGQTPYYGQELERQRLLLLAQAAPQDAETIARLLPEDDRELLLRARLALAQGDARRAAALLDAAQDQGDAAWQLLRGDASLAADGPEAAAAYFHRAEAALPEQAFPRLEVCYRRMEDYKMAYEYACRQRG